MRGQAHGQMGATHCCAGAEALITTGSSGTPQRWAGKDRDMEKATYLWVIAIEEARALQSTWGFDEALATYELMEVAWPGEQRIADLRDHIVHWE